MLTLNLELEDLCAKYGFGISACGCCDSPWLTTEERTYINFCIGDNGKASCMRETVYTGITNTYIDAVTNKRTEAEEILYGFRINRNGKVER